MWSLCEGTSKPGVCFQMMSSISFRRNHIFRAGELWQNFSITFTNIYHFVYLKKESLVDELDARGINTDRMNRSEMQGFFCYHGIQRPPALLTENVDDISFLSSYEILA